MRENKRKMPKIDTSSYFELAFSKESQEQREFLEKKEEFKKLLYKIMDELNLIDKIESLTVCPSDNNRAELYRDRKNDWPDMNLYMDIYNDNYMNETY